MKPKDRSYCGKIVRFAGDTRTDAQIRRDSEEEQRNRADFWREKGLEASAEQTAAKKILSTRGKQDAIDYLATRGWKDPVAQIYLWAAGGI